MLIKGRAIAINEMTMPIRHVIVIIITLYLY